MTETALQIALHTICRDLETSGAHFALIGGLAVSARTEPRFTRDVDLAVAVTHDSEAEALIRFLTQRQYQIQAIVEQEAVNRIATVRLISPVNATLVIDLLFASSGIEPEIVAAAQPVQLIEGLVVRVAAIPHLIATKVLSRDDERRPQDRVDLISLLKVATDEDIAAVREALRTIEARGFHRGKNLLAELTSLPRP